MKLRRNPRARTTVPSVTSRASIKESQTRARALLAKTRAGTPITDDDRTFLIGIFEVLLRLRERVDAPDFTMEEAHSIVASAADKSAEVNDSKLSLFASHQMPNSS